MAGNIKVGGHTVFTHTGPSGAGTLSVQGQNGNVLLSDDGTAVSLGNNVKLPASGGIKDSSGNNILTESGGNVSVGNVRLPTNGGIKDSSGNNVLTESGGNVSVGNVRLPTTGGIKDSSGNNVLTESGGNVSISKGTLGTSVVFPAGHVIDFKTATITNEISSALSNDVWFNTGLSASITPKYTNSKIYIISHAGVATTTTLHNALKVVRTGPATADLAIQSTYNSTGYALGLGAYTAYDSPNTDSIECTYTLHVYVDNLANSQYFYNYDALFASTATLSLMEIKQ